MNASVVPHQKNSENLYFQLKANILIKTFGSTVQGVNAYTITVEVSVSPGTKYFLVGLPDNAVKESEQRIKSVQKHFGYKIPRQKIVINMAPTISLRKAPLTTSRCYV